MEKLYEAWRDYDIAFFYIYTREPHPGFNQKPQTRSIKERQANAKQCGGELGMTLPWIIDDMKSTIQKAYGGLPNCAYIITSGGKVSYKEAWANAKNLDEKLKELYESNSKFKANAVKYFQKKMPSEKDTDKRAELGVKLGKLACKEACKALCEIFKKEKDTGVRAKLTQTFALTKQKECIEFLIRLLADETEEVRAAAIETLEKLTGEKFGYDAAAKETERAESTAKWNQWWSTSRKKLAWSEDSGRFKVVEK